MSLTVLFMPESAYGPTNNCIGIGDVLRRRGHRVVFAAEASWAGKLTALGFEEDLVSLAPAPDEPLAPEGPGSSAPSVGPGAGSSTDAGRFWKDFIRDTAPEFRKPTIEQLETWVKPVWQELIDGAKFCQPQLLEIIERVKPDVIVEDNVVAFPALNTAGVPFVRIVSCNPLEKKGPDIAPVFSGYPASSREGWADFLAEYDRTHRPMWEQFNDWVVEQGAPALPDLEFIHEGALNLYVYPRVLDYTDRRRLAPTWKRLESSVRETDAEWKLPDGFVDEHRADGRKLIYFSLGSLGSADVELMRRLIAALARTDHRYIVSKGPLHEEITLADNMIGAEFLPQTTIMPLVDLVITHGGNNTTTEAMHFGKPMVVLPLFWDQYDNAQRVHERGYGVRLDTYGFTDEQLHAAIERLLGDAELRDRLAKDAAEIRAADGLRVAADAIERLGPAGK